MTPIRDATPDDAPSLCAIYNPYVRESHATFEETPVADAEMAARVAAAAPATPWLVWDEGGILGYALAVPWKSRCAYRYSVETSVYLDPGAAGRGIGTRLYGALLERVRAAGMRSCLAGIALPNPASVALHEKLGFVAAGRFREVGWKLGRRIDVGYWQLIFPDPEA